MIFAQIVLAVCKKGEQTIKISIMETQCLSKVIGNLTRHNHPQPNTHY